MLLVILLLHTLFVSLAMGNATSPLPLNSLHRLLVRQSSTVDPSEIPAQCKSHCDIVMATVASCQQSTNPTCGCTVTAEAGFVDCLNCLIAIVPSQKLLNAEQQYVNELIHTCKSYGVSLPSTTLSAVVGGATITGPTSHASATSAPNVAARDGGSARKGVVVTLLAAATFVMFL